MNIYDCFMYFDEDMLLDLRLNVLNKYVKKFIITEATYTHSGVKKKLKFDINNFKKFKEKIIYIVVDKEPPNLIQLKKEDSAESRGEKLILNGYARDNFQRESLSRGLKDVLDEDLIIISDLDEIPNLESVGFESIKNKIIIFKQKMFYYKLNLFYENLNWHGSKACLGKNFQSPQWLRNIKSKKYSPLRIDLWFSKKKYSDICYINNGGWHFTNIRSPKELQKKLLNFAHHHEFEESKLQLKDLEEFIEKKIVMYDHQLSRKESKWSGRSILKKINDDFLPSYLSSNRFKYREWLD